MQSVFAAGKRLHFKHTLANACRDARNQSHKRGKQQPERAATYSLPHVRERGQKHSAQEAQPGEHKRAPRVFEHSDDDAVVAPKDGALLL